MGDSIREAIKNYDESKEQIYNHCGFKEDWAVYPIDIRTEMYWSEDGNEVRYSNTKEGYLGDGDYYADEIYRQRFYKKWVFRGSELTLIIVDTHCDGNKFFAIFDNAKEIVG